MTHSSFILLYHDKSLNSVCPKIKWTSLRYVTMYWRRFICTHITRRCHVLVTMKWHSGQPFIKDGNTARSKLLSLQTLNLWAVYDSREMIFIFLIESPLASVPSLVSLFIMKIIIQKHCLSWAHYCDPEPTMYVGCNPRTAYWIIVNWHWHLTASGIRHIQKRQACCRYDVERIGIHIDIVTSKALDSMSYLSLIFYRGHFSHDIIIEWHSPSPSDWFDTPLFKGGGRSIDSFILHTAAKNWFTSFWFYIIVILLGRLNREILWKVPASVYSSHKVWWHGTSFR